MLVSTPDSTGSVTALSSHLPGQMVKFLGDFLTSLLVLVVRLDICAARMRGPGLDASVRRERGYRASSFCSMTKWGTSNATCPTAPPLPRAINRVHPSLRRRWKPQAPRSSHALLHPLEVGGRHQHQMRSWRHCGRHLPCSGAIAAGEPYGVSDVRVLPLGVDGGCVLNLRAHSPFQQRITVEPAAVLADLRQPGPHRRNGCVDGHRTRGARADTSSSPGSTAVTSSSSAHHVYIHERTLIRYSATTPSSAVSPASHGLCLPIRRG